MWWPGEVILALACLVIRGGSAFGDDRRPTTSSLLKQLSSKNPDWMSGLDAEAVEAIRALNVSTGSTAVTSDRFEVMVSVDGGSAQPLKEHLEEQHQEFEMEQPWIVNFKFVVEGVAQATVGFVGMIGNLLSIAVLYRRDMDLKPIFRQILIALITFDFFFIVFNLVLFSIPHFSIQYDKQVFPYLVPYVLPLAQIAQTGSIYSTLAVAIERYVSVCHPHFTPPHCTGNLSVAALLIFSFLFNSLRFVEFRTVYDYRNVSFTDVATNETIWRNISTPRAESTELRRDRTYSQVFMYVMLIAQGIIPLVVLIVLNAKIYTAIRARTQRLATMTSRQRRDLTVAAVLVGIILLFIVCHSFKFVVNAYEAHLTYSNSDLDIEFSDAMVCLISLGHLSVTVNSSMNFLIYCYKDEKFRTVLLRMSKESLNIGNDAWCCIKGRNRRSPTRTLNSASGCTTMGFSTQQNHVRKDSQICLNGTKMVELEETKMGEGNTNKIDNMEAIPLKPFSKKELQGQKNIGAS